MLTPLQQYMQPLQEHLGIDYWPAAIMKRIDECTKDWVKGPWANPAPWSQRPDFNIAVTYLKEDSPYLVVDVDGLFSHADDQYIYLTTGTRLPLTLYTHTTCNRKAHLYYYKPSVGVTEETIREALALGIDQRSLGTSEISLPTRPVGKVEPKVDVFIYGNIFEGHDFGEGVQGEQFHFHPIVKFPSDHPYIERLESLPAIDLDFKNGYPISQPRKAYAVRTLTRLMREHNALDTSKTYVNQLIRQVIPLSLLPKGKRKILEHIDFNYDFVNNTTYKLTLVSELSTQEVYEFMELFIKYGFNKDAHADPKQRFDKNIFGTLQWRDAIPLEAEEHDRIKTLEEIRSTQVIDDSVKFIVLKTLEPTGKGGTNVKFMALDAVTLEPFRFNDAYTFDKNSIMALAPWRVIRDETGAPKAFDENVPVVEYHTSPYHPPVDTTTYYLRINLYQPTEYLRQANPQQADVDNSSNVLFKLVRSVVDPQYRDFFYRWYAYVIFDPTPPETVLWMASEKGGAGKSSLTNKLFDRIIGTAASSVAYKDALSGWADVVLGKRILSIEDVPHLLDREWNELYGFIKRQSDKSNRGQNKKGKEFTSGRVILSITGSSNYLPKLDVDDRRFFCLEPAHTQETEEAPSPLTQEEQLELTRVLDSLDYHDEIQEFVDHLYWVYKQPLTTEQENELRVRAPMTHYKERWIQESRPYLSRVPLLIATNPRGLISLVRDKQSEEYAQPKYPLDDIIEALIATYSPTGKKYNVGLPWKWFEALADHITSSDKAWSRASLADAMGLSKGFSNISAHFWEAYSQTRLGQDASPHEGYQFAMPPEVYEEYLQILKELRTNQPDDGLQSGPSF